MMSRLSQLARLTVTPSAALIDTQVAIQATGLKANGPVTIRSVSQMETRHRKVKFEGHGHYIADDGGVVSVPQQMSLGGTYIGAESMGLFWSMQPTPDQKLGTRFFVKDVTNSVKVNLSLHNGHLDNKALQTAESEATATAERWYMGKNVERTRVHSGRLRGALFKPKGSGPFPGVIDMFGIGGLVEFRAAMLASHGLACFALPHSSYEDLPLTNEVIHLEYFKEAIDWLSDQPFVKPGGVSMVGTSRGAQYALATASHFPEKLRAVVVISGLHAHSLFPCALNGEHQPFVELLPTNIEPSLKFEGAKVVFAPHKEMYKVTGEHAAIFKLENARQCQFLFIAGEADDMYDSCFSAREAATRLSRHGCSNYQILSYPDAGHLIEVPYAPSASVFSLPGYGVIVNGGSTAGNAKAMEDSWRKTVRFLHIYGGR
ncbi:acyl-coenzyme A amino acid N-acyltransferase 2-like [Acanthaster planci]|uniref:Acyl-coenzyme A amino acid N-acyltransferase 2-like n=1 Tax=Acanthaster planci TaxID=133434 RepID=A0A8B7ZWG1_ACAPL|nr:acyl-coenzyme A amino acid N-acyltransferase 2-like [Acanthaster planci]